MALRNQMYYKKLRSEIKVSVIVDWESGRDLVA